MKTRLLFFVPLIIVASLRDSQTANLSPSLSETMEVTGVVDISVNESSTCLLKRDEVICFGQNAYGQAQNVKGFENARQITAGEGHTCVLDDQGVWCYSYSQNSNLEIPTSVKHPSFIAAGGFHTCAIESGKVICWGSSFAGNLNVPPHIKNPQTLAVGSYSTCALDDDGVKCWGQNNFGQLEVPDFLGRPRNLVAGQFHYCALDDEGVKCWGRNDESQLNVSAMLKKPNALGAGFFHTCGLESNQVVCWGKNDSGQAKIVTPMVRPLKIVGGGSHTCAIGKNEVKCWGSNALGQSSVPIQLVNPKNIFGSRYSVCVQDDDKFRCWGLQYGMNVLTNSNPSNLKNWSMGPNYSNGCTISNEHSKVQCWHYHSFNLANVPTELSDPDPANPELFPETVSVGGDHGCVILKNGKLKCWGSNSNGQVTVPDIREPILKVVSTFYGNCAATKERVVCWGEGNFSSLIKVTKPTELVTNWSTVCAKGHEGWKCAGPATATWLKDGIEFGASSVHLGFDHLCYLLGRRPVCLGTNQHGQLNIPLNLSEVDEIFAAGSFSCGRLGTQLRCWGDNSYGQTNVPSL